LSSNTKRAYRLTSRKLHAHFLISEPIFACKLSHLGIVMPESSSKFNELKDDVSLAKSRIKKLENKKSAAAPSIASLDARIANLEACIAQLQSILIHHGLAVTL
jgi:hypothetical protein